MDHLTPQQRHKNMAAIHNKNTKPEIIVRCGLWKRGFMYITELTLLCIFEKKF